MVVWGISIAAGCVVLQAYANQPGKAGPSPSGWPKECVIPLDDRRPTLLLFLHPLCPCSRASVDELAELVAFCGDRLAAHIVVLRTDSLENEGLDRDVLPGMKTWDDDGGALARRFGVLTSGHVLLYDPHGRLRYSGGITPARGHRGNNFGRSAVLAAVLGATQDSGPIPVFGCPLFEPRSTQAEDFRR
jgi:hypothetical protein